MGLRARTIIRNTQSTEVRPRGMPRRPFPRAIGALLDIESSFVMPHPSCRVRESSPGGPAALE